MKITEISRQKKNLDRVSIFLDGEFWTGMSEDLFLDLELVNNQEISQEEKKEIEEKVIKDTAFAFAVRSLSQKQVSASKLAEKLSARDYGEDVIKGLIEKLTDLNILDDLELARAIIEYRVGRFEYKDKIRFRLKDAGIPDEIIEKTLNEEFRNINQLELAKKALRNRYRDKLLDLKTQSQALNYLQRNSFSYNVAKRAIEERSLSKESEAKINTKEKALKDLKKRYSDQDIQKSNFYNRASGFLLRKGYLPEVAKEAIKELIS